MILDMAEDAHTQVTLSSILLSTMRCKIDVKEGQFIFDVGEHDVEFGLFKGLSFPLLLFIIVDVMC